MCTYKNGSNSLTTCQMCRRPRNYGNTTSNDNIYSPVKSDPKVSSNIKTAVPQPDHPKKTIQSSPKDHINSQTINPKRFTKPPLQNSSYQSHTPYNKHR
eukprot:UN07592